jgi:hypothetical protein
MSDKRDPLVRSKTIESFATNATERIMTPNVMDPCFDQAMLDCSRVGESVGRDIRDIYEFSIEKGDLIRKDELIAWLKERERVTDGRELRTDLMSHTHSMWVGENSAWKQLLKYLDRKP